MYPVTYIQGESYTVHMDDHDLLFVHEDKMYVADFSDWLVTDNQRKEELHTGLSLLTVAEKESMYSSKDVRRALEAGELLRAMGYPTQAEAISMVQSGNVFNVPHSVDDVNRFYDIYRPQVAGIRGRTTKRHAKRQSEPDSTTKLQITYQDLVADVMHVAGQKFLVSVSSPLELLMTYHIGSQSTQELGNALQQHINTLRSRGFEPRRVLVDPHSPLVKLRGSYPGVEVDPVGAGDHLDKIDSKIHRVKEVARSVVAGLPYKLPQKHVKDLITYTVSRVNLRSTSALNTQACPRVRFTGYRPNFKSELGLAFGDYVEVYNPKTHERSNDVFTERTEPCIALYPTANRNGSWVFYNLRTESYVRRSQWKKLPTPQLVIDIMNKLAGVTGVSVAEILGTQEPADFAPMSEAVHTPLEPQEQIVFEFEADTNRQAVELPELEDQGDDDSTSESSALPDGGEDDLEALERLLEGDEDVIEETKLQMAPPLRRSTRHNAGVARHDDRYEWNLMNLGVGEAIRELGNVASDACKAELQQLFVEKKALQPVKWSGLSREQRRKVIRSHMFLKEKYEDGAFVKMKARLVADGRMQDRSVYPDHSSPTVKTRSVMTCLKLAAMKGWGLTKIDIADAYLFADIDEHDEVFMLLDKSLSSMCEEWVPEVKEYLREDGKLVVKLDKALYGLIQSAKLWYRELSGFLLEKGFAACPSDQCVFVKKINNGKYIVALLYVDDILVLSELGADREWVCQILEDRYGKVTVSENERLPYLGMTIIKTDIGYEVCMKVYIEETIKLYGKTLREYVTPAAQKLFDVTSGSKKCSDSVKFYSVVAKLLYLGKRGRPDILTAVQFLCTRAKEPTLEDEKKLE
jgi:hypothetical protein